MHHSVRQLGLPTRLPLQHQHCLQPPSVRCQKAFFHQLQQHQQQFTLLASTHRGPGIACRPQDKGDTSTQPGGDGSNTKPSQAAAGMPDTTSSVTNATSSSADTSSSTAAAPAPAAAPAAAPTDWEARRQQRVVRDLVEVRGICERADVWPLGCTHQSMYCTPFDDSRALLLAVYGT